LDSIIKQQINQSGKCVFSQPCYVAIDDTSTIEAAVTSSSIKFPVICKPIEACGTPYSHSMVDTSADDNSLFVLMGGVFAFL
jgi:hypothetical protein